MSDISRYKRFEIFFSYRFGRLFEQLPDTEDDPVCRKYDGAVQKEEDDPERTADSGGESTQSIPHAHSECEEGGDGAGE